MVEVGSCASPGTWRICQYHEGVVVSEHADEAKVFALSDGGNAHSFW